MSRGFLPACDAVSFTGSVEEHFSPCFAGRIGGIGANGFDVVHQERKILFDGGPIVGGGNEVQSCFQCPLALLGSIQPFFPMVIYFFSIFLDSPTQSTRA